MKISKLNQFIQKEDNKTALIIDFHNLVYRTVNVAHHQAPDDEDFLYWKYLIMNSLFASLKQFKPSKVIIAIDSSNSWRKEIYSDYKAHRKEQRDKSKIDYDKFHKVLNVFQDSLKKEFSNIYFIKVDKCEGDDVIATICKERLLDYKKIIVSGDKDFVQLLQYKNIKLYNPMDHEFVENINPKMQLELKILIGDKSDNITAIKPKFGIKSAEKVLNDGLSDILLDEAINAKYKINRQIIDFDYIPEDIQLGILKEFDEYKIKKIVGMNVLHWLAVHKINKFSEDFSYYFTLLEYLS